MFLLLRSPPASEGTAPSARAIFVVAVVALSLPFMAYVRLIYPKILLLLIVACALLALKRGRVYATVILIALLPFVHGRAIFVSPTFLAITLFGTGDPAIGARRRWYLVTLYFATLCLVASLQLKFFGSILGGAASRFEPSLSQLPERVGMQLFDVRHGLIAYSPIYLVGFAGLIVGTLRRNAESRNCLILLITFVSTFVWGTASESWTARYWVGALPLLAVGISYWLQSSRSASSYAVLLPLLAVTAANTYLFIVQPAWFLENRDASLTYAILFRTVHVHLGLFLPVDSDASWVVAYTQPIPALLWYTAVVIVLLVCCKLTMRTTIRRSLTLLTYAVLIAPFVLGLVQPLPSSAYTVTSIRYARTILIHVIAARASVRGIEFEDNLFNYWNRPNYPDMFRVTCVGGVSGAARRESASRSLLVLHGCSNARSIEIVGAPLSAGDAIFSRPGRISVLVNSY